MNRTASVPTVHRGADDLTLTSHAGMMLVRDLNSKLHLVERLDAAYRGDVALQATAAERRAAAGLPGRVDAGWRRTPGPPGSSA